MIGRLLQLRQPAASGVWSTEVGAIGYDSPSQFSRESNAPQAPTSGNDEPLRIKRHDVIWRVSEKAELVW